jgi:hypothetical protein
MAKTSGFLAKKVDALWPALIIPMALIGGFVGWSAYVGEVNSEALDHVGGLMGGFAAISAALFAIIKAPQEWSIWKRQREADKMAEVAGRCAMEAHRISRIGEVLTAAMVAKRENTKPELDAFHKQTVENALSAWYDVRPHLEEACQMSEAFLPDDDARAAMRMLWDEHVDIVLSPLLTDGKAMNAASLKAHTHRVTELMRRYTLAAHLEHQRP